jgi:hypothetical protein
VLFECLVEEVADRGGRLDADDAGDGPAVASACSRSTSILTSSSRPSRLATSASIAGASMRHGPHQAAQKSTTTGSMDYTVFLLSSAKEHWDRSHDPKEAAVGGIAHSGRVIFAAAAVMVAVFFTFALSGPLPPKEMGVISASPSCSTRRSSGSC